jgi:hypothetical protein
MLYICPKDKKTTSPTDASEFLDSGQFTLDKKFLDDLPWAARKRVKDSVIEALGKRKVAMRLLRRAEVQSLLCRFYEVSAST